MNSGTLIAYRHLWEWSEQSDATGTLYSGRGRAFIQLDDLQAPGPNASVIRRVSPFQQMIFLAKHMPNAQGVEW